MILGALLVLSLVLGKGAGGRSGAPAVVHPNRAPGVVAAAAIVARRRTATSVLGVRIGMSETQAHRRLGALGLKRRLDNEEAETQGREPVEGELWTLKTSHLRYVVVGIESGRVVSLQAYVRPGHHTLRYADIGDLQEAKRLGFYIYEWAVAGRNGAPAVRVEARGVDPEYLGSYLIVRQRPNVGASDSPTEASEAGVERDP